MKKFTTRILILTSCFPLMIVSLLMIMNVGNPAIPLYITSSIAVLALSFAMMSFFQLIAVQKVIKEKFNIDILEV